MIAHKPTVENYREHLIQLIKELENKLIEREQIIRIMILAIFSKQHVFLIGDPGVGKTYLTELLANAISDAVYFDFLVANDTTQEELLGATIRDTETGKVSRSTDGTMLGAHIVFLDEMFKGQSILLNSFLGIMNERVYKMGNAGTIKVPLVSLFGASNEFPSGKALEPYDDRLIFRYEVCAIQEEENFIKYISGNFDTDSSIRHTLSLSDIEYCNMMSKTVDVTTEIKELLVKLKKAIRGDSIKISDRKLGPKFAMSVFKMSAYLNGRNSVDMSDIVLLYHMAWRDYSDKTRAHEVIAKVMFKSTDVIKVSLDSIAHSADMLFGKLRSQYVKYLDFEEALVQNKKLEEDFSKLYSDIKTCGTELENLIESSKHIFEEKELQDQAAAQIANNIFLYNVNLHAFTDDLISKHTKLTVDMQSNMDKISFWLNECKDAFGYESIRSRKIVGSQMTF